MYVADHLVSVREKAVLILRALLRGSGNNPSQPDSLEWAFQRRSVDRNSVVAVSRWDIDAGLASERVQQTQDDMGGEEAGAGETN